MTVANLAYRVRGMALVLFMFNIGITVFFSILNAMRLENPYIGLSGTDYIIEQTHGKMGEFISPSAVIADNNKNLSVDYSQREYLLELSKTEIAGQEVLTVKPTSYLWNIFFSSDLFKKLIIFSLSVAGVSFAGLVISGVFTGFTSPLSVLLVHIAKIAFGFAVLTGATSLYLNAQDFVAATIGTDVPFAVTLYMIWYWGVVIALFVSFALGKAEEAG